ncbi:MAG TPA: PEP-utilizing enzyme [Gemmatimonadaceae bacterium]
MEFAIANSRIYLTQTRPITTLTPAATPSVAATSLSSAAPMLHGLGASPGMGTGPVRILQAVGESAALRPGEILVTRMTSPDWVPLMRRAAAIVTDEGGMTSHGAIVSRELGIPCVVGTREATRILHDGMVVTVNGREGTVTEAASRAAASAPHPTPREGALSTGLAPRS